MQNNFNLCAMKSTKLILSLVLFALLLVMPCRSCRAGGSYRIYESELNQLLQILQQLENNYNSAKSNLQTSKQQLEQQERQLQQLQGQLVTLKSQIGQLEIQSNRLSEKLKLAETNLAQLEKYFEAYKKEAEARIRKLAIQRNIAAVFAVILGVLAL